MFRDNLVISVYEKSYTSDVDEGKVEYMLNHSTELNPGIYDTASNVEKITNPAGIDSTILKFVDICNSDNNCNSVLYDKDNNKLVYNIDNISYMFYKHKESIINELNNLTIKDCSFWGKYDSFCNRLLGLGDYKNKPILLVNGLFALDYVHALFTIAGNYLLDGDNKNNKNKNIELYIDGVYKFEYYN